MTSKTVVAGPLHRFDVADARPGLRFPQVLVNTTLQAGQGDPARDDLTDVGRADAWLFAALTESGHRQHVNSATYLTVLGLRSPRAFREDLRVMLRVESPDLISTIRPAEVGAKLTLDVDGGLSFRVAGPGWRAVAGLALMDLTLGRADGDLNRLKTCANEPCGLAFYDRSPNTIRRWHDTRSCGNVVDLRASRSRRAFDRQP